MSSAARNVTPLRVGLIGCGKMGLHHLRAIAASNLGTVVGVADPMASADEIRLLAGESALVVDSADEMLDRAQPDVVHIVTPPETHADLAARAIARGCHVYVEKPFAPTVADAARIVQRAAERGVKVCAGHQVLFEAPALRAREALAEIGRLVHVESYFSFKMVRRTITPVQQLQDILPHAVYPVVDQLRLGTGIAEAPIDIAGLSVDATGEAYALLKLGPVTAVVLVSLNARPVEQYQALVGTNGSLRADYIGGCLIKLVGPGTGPGVLLTPYRRALQTTTGTTRGIVRLLRGGSYPGLRTLVGRFYESIRDGTPAPMSPQSILDTVGLCEQIGQALEAAERIQESRARTVLETATAALPAPSPTAPLVLVTGGTGMLGRRVLEELRGSGVLVRSLGRRVPPFSRRVPGVEYAVADLARPLDPALFRGATFVAHCAAETAGGKEEHRRNSIVATRHVIEAAAAAGVKGVVHVSSLAVLKSSREVGRPLDETAPLDAGNLKRGPYVWGKAESEIEARTLGESLGIPVRVVRPGPLVDWTAYHPPGRLGRELGPLFVAIGPKNGSLSVCDVSTAARVIRSYVTSFAQAPAVLNLVEAPPPTRRALMDRYRRQRPDLRVFWFPSWLLRALSGPAKLAQRLVLGAKEPLDVAAAFASERYQVDLAARVIADAEHVTPPPSVDVLTATR